MVKRGMKLMFKNFDVIAKRKLWFSASGLLVLLFYHVYYYVPV